MTTSASITDLSSGSAVTSDVTTPSPTYSASTVAIDEAKGLITSVTSVADTAGNIEANLDILAQVAAAGYLGTVTLTDQGTLILSAAKLTADAAVLKAISGPYTLFVTDTPADVAASLDTLQYFSTKATTVIALTGGGIPTLSITAAQSTADAGALSAISGYFDISVAASDTATITGVAGHGTIVVFSGAAANYAITPGSDGVSLTVGSDHLSTVTELKFSDHTDFVASTTPAVAGAVSSAEVANLYSAVFARAPDVAGLAYYEAQAAATPSRSIISFAESFLSSPEYTGNTAHNYAQSSDGDAKFITDTYENLLHRAPEAGAVAWYQTNVINPILNGATPGTAAYTQASLQAHATVLAGFSQSGEFLSDVQVTAQHPSDAQHWLVLI